MSDFDARMKDWAKRAEEASKRFRDWVPTQPQARPCDRHPEITLSLDVERCRIDRPPVYSLCAACEADAAEADTRKRLRAQGVPAVLVHASFNNWTPRTNSEQEVLVKSRAFAACRRGFLVLLGNVGTGKSHLAVAAMREFKSALFVKHDDLMRRLRATYRHTGADDPVSDCRQAGFLVLDEIGLSGGGRDELPTLHSILDFRYGDFLPTVLTGNVGPDDLDGILGARLVDRLRESATVLTFSGPSHRAEGRQRYFGAEKPPGRKDDNEILKAVW